MDLKEVMAARKNTGITLRDYHTLQARGGQEYRGIITDVCSWTTDAVKIWGLVVKPDEDTTLMVLARRIGDADELADIRICRMWSQDVANELSSEPNSPIEWREDPGDIEQQQDEDETFSGYEFCDFGVAFDDGPEGDPLAYSIKSPFPFFGVRTSDGDEVGICEWSADTDRVADNYWARHAFCDWYCHVGDGGEDGLLTMWFGWEVGSSDVLLSVVV